MVPPPADVEPDARLPTTRPTSVDELRIAIEKLGAQLAACNRRCQGVRCDISTGSMPRCLIFESRGCDSLEGGVIVVGKNPAPADHDERDVIMGLFGPGHVPEHSYAGYVAWQVKAMQSIPFYTRMRAAVTTMGFVGPILWTELVKCESGDEIVVLGKEKPVKFGLGEPFQSTTVRTCRDKYLRAELALCPPEWPIVAAGLEVGDYLQETRNELTGQRALVAVPHPTGSRGLFFQIFVPTSLSTSQSVLERIPKARTTGGFARISTDSQREHPGE